MKTGQTFTQALQVVHDQSSCSLTRPLDSAPVEPSRIPEPRSLTRSRGERSLPAAYAGQTSWHLPQFVQASRARSWRGLKSELEVTFGGVSTLPVSSIAARLKGVLSRPMDLGSATATLAPEVKTWTSLV